MGQTRKPAPEKKQPAPAKGGRAKAPAPEPAEKAAPAKALGRKRDPQRDHAILDATLEILAETGFDSMTMDQVAARAKAGKATLYRRWPSKGELVRDALIGMSRNSIETDHIPDTGNLRDDLLGLMKPHSMEYSERKLKVLSGLGSFSTRHKELHDEALEGIFAPWVRVNAALMERAVARGELPPGADIPLACEIIISFTAYRTSLQRRQFGKAAYRELLEKILLPGLGWVRR